MSFKKNIQKIGRYIWEFFKMSLIPFIMYACGSLILLMLTLGGKTLGFTSTKLTWWIIGVILLLAYNGLVAYAQGSMGFDMLVSGNLRRMTADEVEGGYKMSGYREIKEYRPWKGFVVGGILAIFPIVSAIIFGCNQELIDKVFAQQVTSTNPAFGWVFLIFMVLSGWSNLLFILVNTLGVGISYFLCMIFAILPITVHGVMYIVGAYAKRRKSLRAQELADRASVAQNSPKKVNYGGLPGTKPKKRK